MLRLIATIAVGVILVLLTSIIFLPIANIFITNLLNTLPDTGSYLLFKNFVNFVINNYLLLVLVLFAGIFVFYISVRGD
jgi:hypothetical protein